MRKPTRRLLVGAALATIVCLGGGAWMLHKVSHPQADPALIAAIEQHDVDKAIALIRAGANPNASYEIDPPVSFWEGVQNVLHGRPYRVQSTNRPLALATGAFGDPNPIPGQPNHEPDARCARLVQVMMQYGVDVNARGLGRTPLWGAIERHNVQTAKLLIEHGADVNLPCDETGETPLMLAVSRNAPNMELTRLLLDHHADVNAHPRGMAALTMAGSSDVNAPIVKELLKHHVDVNYSSHSIATALAYAKLYRAKRIIKLLQEAGAK